MRRILWVTACLCLCLGSGCYTVLHHPAVDDAEEPVELGVTDDCRACHSGGLDNVFAWSPMSYAPQWQTFYDRPWWERVATNNARIGARAEGSGLPNTRSVGWAPIPAPIAPAPVLTVTAVPVKAAPETRTSAPAEAPRDSEHRSAPAVAPRGTDHGGNPAPAPRTPEAVAGRTTTRASAPRTAPGAPTMGPNAPPPTNDDETSASSAAPDSTAEPESEATPAQSEGQGMPNNRPRPAR